MCCWITVDWSVVDDFAAQHGKGGRPVLIVCNHTSFFDAFIMCCLCPLSSVTKLCTVASQTLFNIPFMGVIGWGMGMLPIKFKSTDYASTNMAVDKDDVADVMIQLKDAASQGYILGWFPEGRLNRDNPNQLSLFRAGLFGIATELDCELWTVAIVGNSLMWPAHDVFGGNPARIGIKFSRFCESTQEYLQSKGVQADAREAGILLAKETQERTQALVNELLDEGYVNSSPSQSAETLLRQNAKA